ncbi:TIGR04104 family putative zinc finger protein [Peribacillus frigoritolerans]|uniref:TIGR04104 family putative zinc finger protein n=1 Tax=Peribacillus frigoritolerans TaxID=450367 RepID=UPI0014050B3B|nr:TIGR04104 family putative zinc finger protein [Peribacillus frigoritolerans]
MKLPTCRSCHYQFTWKETLLTSLKFTRILKCPKCGTNLFPTPKSRTKGTLLIAIPIVAASFISSILGADAAVRITAIILAGILSVLLSPYYYEYIEEDKPLW